MSTWGDELTGRLDFRTGTKSHDISFEDICHLKQYVYENICYMILALKTSIGRSSFDARDTLIQVVLRILMHQTL